MVTYLSGRAMLMFHFSNCDLNIFRISKKNHAASAE
jgi:hypothetical protein